MRYFQKLLCLLILVLAASFGVGGCVLLYSDFSVQRSRMAAANAAAHAQACTLLQTEILDLQRRGISTGDAALTARVTAQDVPAALWRGDTLVCATLEGLQSLPLGDASTVTVKTENSIYAVYASDLQGGLRLVTAYDLTGLYRDRNAALMRFLLLEAAVLAAASAVTALLARRLTRPLAVLTDAGAQIAAGDYARRTDLHTGDEIEALSRSFDKMADAVQEKIADLEADVQRREDFVGAFTHELKTPMTSIIGYADMLHTMQTDPDEQREAAAAIVHEGRRLEALSRKLLALLGLNEEGVELTAVPLPALWPRLHAACPDVTLRTPAAAPTVRGDADLLLDLLCNLVQNAAKASAPGAPVLVLCAQAGDAVTLTVADRGCGIPPELIPRVTEPFYMVDKIPRPPSGRQRPGAGALPTHCRRPRQCAAHRKRTRQGHPGQCDAARLEGGCTVSLWNHPRLTAALCTVAVLGCAAAPAVFLAAADAASLGRVETVADPYVAPTPTADDYYILRQLAARSRNAESEREQRPAEVLTAPKMYIGASASLQSMQYADSAAAEAAENALRQLAETGAVPAAWAAEALDTAETGESYTDWDGKYYSLDATYCVTDSLGFVTVRRFGMTDNALFTRYSVTMDSRTGTVVEAWLSMAGTDAENTPLPTETALRSFAAQAGLESLGDWAAPADSPYGCALYSTNGGALITASTHPYTYQDYVGTAPVLSDRWYYSLTLQLRTEDQLPG